MPFVVGDSRRDPARSHIPTDTERTCTIGSRTNTSPLGSSCRKIVGVTFSTFLLTAIAIVPKPQYSASLD
jgi:hypothetical protein